MDEAYRKLRQTPLHECGQEATAVFAEQVAQWLLDPDEETRGDAAERLATAVFWERLPRAMPATEVAAYRAERLGWLTSFLDKAQGIRSDAIPNFLRIMRFRSPRGPQVSIVWDWLDRLEREPPPGLDRDLILAIRITMEDDMENVSPSRWIGLLDHPSDWVRGCAAYRLGGCDEGTGHTKAELLALIGEKEIERPGIAGAFRGEVVLSESDPSLRREVALWMMDLLERRCGSAPADMPYKTSSSICTSYAARHPRWWTA